MSARRSRGLIQARRDHGLSRERLFADEVEAKLTLLANYPKCHYILFDIKEQLNEEQKLLSTSNPIPQNEQNNYMRQIFRIAVKTGALEAVTLVLNHIIALGFTDVLTTTKCVDGGAGIEPFDEYLLWLPSTVTRNHHLGDERHMEKIQEYLEDALKIPQDHKCPMINNRGDVTKANYIRSIDAWKIRRNEGNGCFQLSLRAVDVALTNRTNMRSIEKEEQAVNMRFSGNAWKENIDIIEKNRSNVGKYKIFKQWLDVDIEKERMGGNLSRIVNVPYIGRFLYTETLPRNMRSTPVWQGILEIKKLKNKVMRDYIYKNNELNKKYTKNRLSSLLPWYKYMNETDLTQLHEQILAMAQDELNVLDDAEIEYIGSSRLLRGCVQKASARGTNISILNVANISF